jgi:uncharacterized protein
MEALIKKIVAYIIHTTDPEEIILFGSVASGRHEVNSDIDLLVIMESTYRRSQTKEDIRGFVARFGYHADVLLLTPAELSAAMSDSSSFLHNALKMSRKIY